MGSDGSHAAPVFIGGFGRSGTHAVGGLIGADPGFHLVETEIRLHAHGGGLADLVAGRTDLESFVRRCEERWWSRGAKRPQGIRRLLSREAFDRALDRFREEFADHPLPASRELVAEIVGPGLERSGRPRWAELTGRSAVCATELHRIWPDAVFVNMIRDGRAVAAGHVQKADMTDDPLKALDGWERMIRGSFAGLAAVPADRVLVIDLDHLAHSDREGVLGQLAGVLGVEDLGPMRGHMRANITAGRAHVGAWRERMPPPEARKVERRYLRILRGLRADGIGWFSDPRDQTRLARLGARLPSIHPNRLAAQ
ncbi:hypothetical protein HJD18_00555 [Thermoleophilia bacterium SCSIO 60948]|nr:hypothetical protein HJD18_00555 [Thermoleophilia bacterium SCSIO 60948]